MPAKDPAKQREYARRHYERNRQAMIDRAAAYRKEAAAAVAAYLRDLKAKTPCMDCKVNYPYYVMQFDHVRGEKLFNVAAHNREGKGMNAVKAEVEKCEIVCANCHAVRTHERRHGLSEDEVVQAAFPEQPEPPLVAEVGVEPTA